MKKKLLSVLMAGALVATSSVNAFAADINGLDDQEYDAPITVTGDIEDKEGNTKPGTITVTVPTTAGFTLTKDGAFVGSTITITNKGTGKVDVFAKGFTDSTPTENITVVSEGDVQDRGDVSLRLHGGLGVAYFGSATKTQKTGVYSDSSLTTEVTSQKLETIAKNSEATLRLEGTGEIGQGEDDRAIAIKDNFTLVLKIAKSAEN